MNNACDMPKGTSRAKMMSNSNKQTKKKNKPVAIVGSEGIIQLL